MKHARSISLLFLTSLTLAGCGRSSDQEPAIEAPEETTQSAETPVAPPPAAAPTTAAFEIDDIDRWQRGLQAELEAVQKAGTQLAAAKDENEKLEALHASMEMNTLDAGATAAGVDRDRYRRIRNTFSEAVSQLSPIEMEMDVKQMPPELVEQMQQGREAGAAQLAQQLPAAVFESLKTRAGDLRTLDKTLVGERLKVANAAR